eukprot:g24636.t1
MADHLCVLPGNFLGVARAPHIQRSLSCPSLEEENDAPTRRPIQVYVNTLEQRANMNAFLHQFPLPQPAPAQPAMGLGCGVSLAAAVSTGVSSLELPAVTVVVGKEFEVPVGTFLGQEVTLLVDGEPPHNWLQFNEKHGSLLGRVGAPGSWRISLRAKGDEELPSAHLELFAVDPLHSPSTPAGAPFEEANARPFLVQSVPDIWTKVGQNFQQAVPATSIVDPSGAPLLLTARLKSGSPLPLWLSFDPSTRTVNLDGPRRSVPVDHPEWQYETRQVWPTPPQV